jgi:hypothetical protein
VIRSDSLTTDDLTRICTDILRGVKPYRAVICAGYVKGTYYYWRQQAEAGEEPHRSNIEAIDRAEAEFLARHEASLSQAGASDWKASEKILSHRLRDEYGQKVEVTATTKPPEEMSREELLAVAAGKPVAIPR